MIVVDIGNSNVVIGIYKNQKILKSLRINTNNFNYDKKNKLIFSKIIKKYKFLVKNRLIVFGSVVSKKNITIYKIANYLNYRILDIKNKKIILDLKFNFKNIKELGADRIANSVSGVKNYGKNLIIIDFGTATTFDIVKKGYYIGGIISPGIEISNIALANSASKLKEIKIIKKNNIIGKSTKLAMQSGFYWGYLSLIRGIIKEIVDQQSFKPKIILTGGMANIFSKEINNKVYIDQNLTLNGLYYIGKQNA